MTAGQSRGGKFILKKSSQLENRMNRSSRGANSRRKLLIYPPGAQTGAKMPLSYSHEGSANSKKITPHFRIYADMGSLFPENPNIRTSDEFRPRASEFQ